MANRKSILLGSSASILAVAVLVLGWGIVRKTQLDASSSVLATNTIELLFSAVGNDGLAEAINSESFPAEEKPAVLRQMTLVRRTTGTLVSIEAVVGAADVPLIPLMNPTTASYKVALTTRGGEIEASLKFVWRDGAWLIEPMTFTGGILQN